MADCKPEKPVRKPRVHKKVSEENRVEEGEEKVLESWWRSCSWWWHRVRSWGVWMEGRRERRLVEGLGPLWFWLAAAAIY